MKHGVFSSLLMLFVSTAAFAVAEPESVSLQDLKPECRERHPPVGPEQCMIQDRVIVRQYARRFGEPVIVITPPPATTERQTPASTAPPAAIQVIPAAK